MPVTPLPEATDFTGAAVTQGELKTALTQLIAYLSDHLGDTVIPSGPLSGFRNAIINGNFSINQSGYVSGAAVPANKYGHDMWKMATAGDTYTFSIDLGVTTVIIPSGKVLQQVIEGLNLQSGTYTLSWTGTAQGKIGAGSYGASGITGTATGGTDLTIEFGPGTISKVQFEFGTTATPFENRPYGTELALCQRYYYDTGPSVTGGYPRLNGYGAAGTVISSNIKWPVTMRTAPTVTVLSSGGWALTNCSAPVASSSTTEGIFLSATITATGGADAYAGPGNKAVIASARL